MSIPTLVGDVGNGQRSFSAACTLNDLGYKQKLTRTRGRVHVLSMLITMTAVPFGLAAPMSTALLCGGPVVMVWGLVITALATQPLALSLAEICSKYPTSAGPFYWSFVLAPPKFRHVVSWVNGWFMVVGVWMLNLSVSLGTAHILTEGIQILRPEWVPAPWQIYLIFACVCLFSTLIGVGFNRHLPTIDIIGAIWIVLGSIVTLVCLLVKADVGRHSASYAFGQFGPVVSGWTPGWSFFMGLFPSTYAFSAIAMVANMAEEAYDPTIHIPMALTWVTPIGLIVGLIYILPIVFTLPNVLLLLSTPEDRPMGVLFTLVMGSKAGAFGMWLILFGIGTFCCISISCATSRATWSFARDKGIPFHVFWSKLRGVDNVCESSASLGREYSDGIPLNAYLLALTFQVLLGLIHLGTFTAFKVIVGISMKALELSSVIPLIFLVWDRRRDVADAPFSLGKWGYVCNIFAILWTFFQNISLSLPGALPVPVTPVVYGAVIPAVIGMVISFWYHFGGRKIYTGPSLPNEKSIHEDSEEKDVPS